MAVSNTQTVNGLSTTTINIPTTDFYTVAGTLQLPTAGPTASTGAGGGAGTGAVATNQTQSQVVVTVNHNGSPIYTGAAGAKGFSTGAQCTAGDTMTVVLTSSLSQDQQPNAVSATITTVEGAI